MTTDTNFSATGPGNVGFQVNGNVSVGVEATGSSTAGSFHLANTTRGASALKADNPLCNATLCGVGFSHLSQKSFGIAVMGQADNGTAIWGLTDSGTGVLGQSSSGVALQGSSASGRGVFGDSGGNHGVHGQTESASHAGVSAANLAVNSAVGFLALNDPRRSQPSGVYGESPNQGVVGFSNGQMGVGVFGEAGQSGSNHDPATGGTGVLGSGYIGVRGETQTGVAVLGRIFGPGLAGRFEGDVEITGRGRFGGDVQITGRVSHGGSVNVAGDIEVTGDIRLINQDLAEEFDVQETAGLEPGSVMVLGAEGKLQPCRDPYDRKVAGVIAGAGAFKPAIVLGKIQSLQQRLPIALLGKVYCKVDAEYGNVEVGDLLTASPTLGHAMKVTDSIKALGAVIGKALGSLDSGRSLIPMLITLQ